MSGSAESPWRVRAGALAIAVAGALAYTSSFQGAYVYDDVLNLVDNPYLTPLWPPGGWLWARPGFGLAGRPVASFSFALNHAVSGLDTWSYHALNLVIHLAAALLLFGLLRRALGRTRLAGEATGLALTSALLWVVHPLNTGAITYLYQRCESLMGAFLVATCYCALRAFAAERARVWSAAAVASCFLGAGCKETMVVAPLLVLALDALLVSDSCWAALRVRRGFYAALFLSWAWIALLVVTSGARADSVGFGFAHVTLWDYLRTQATGLVLYAKLVVWPAPLVFDYGWPIPTRAMEWVPHGLLVLAALSATALALLRRSPLALVGAWFFLILAPSSSVLPIATEVVVEHRMYLPGAALILLAVLGVRPLVRAAGRWGSAALVAVTALILGVLTFARNHDYESPERLWRVTLAEAPDNARAHYALADILRLDGRTPEALEHFLEAARLQPDEPFWRLNPGVLLLAQGEAQRAVEQLEAAARLKPDWALAHYNLGRALVAAARPLEAIEAFGAALELEPGWVEAGRGLGIAQSRAGREGAALDTLTAVLAALPGDLETVVELGELRVHASAARVRSGEEALRLGRMAVRLSDGGDGRALALLAAAEADTGDFEAAVLSAQRALELAPDGERAAYEAQLARYREGRTP
jgi:tetratricopeptide (TPR) repeat protein